MDNQDGKVGEWLRVFPNLGKFILRVSRDPRVPRRSKVILGLVAAYIVVPLDIIPDWIPGIGRLDDVALLVLALDGLLSSVPDEVIADHWDGDIETLERIRRGLHVATRIVPNRITRRLFAGD